MMASNTYLIKQGDAYAVPVRVKLDGATLTAEDITIIDSVEFTLGEYFRKLYPDEVVFDAQEGLFLVPVTQEETFAMEEGERVSFDVRVKFTSGDVIGTKTMEKIKIVDALSEVEL